MCTRVATTMVMFGTLVRHTGGFGGPRAVLSGRALQLPWTHQLNRGASRSSGQLAPGSRSLSSSTPPHATSTQGQQDVFDFETHVDRANTGALKWDKYAGKDVIPLWVADMDLKTAPAIVSAVRDRLDHGIFGYTSPTEGAQEAVMKYYKVSERVSE